MKFEVCEVKSGVAQVRAVIECNLYQNYSQQKIVFHCVHQ